MNEKDFTRMFSGFDFSEKELNEGSVVKFQIMKVGKWKHQLYGNVIIDEKTIDEVKNNFDKNKRGIDLALDENHESNHKALGWFKELYKEGKDKLYATIELTKRGAKLLKDGSYKYFSPEFIVEKKDEETGEIIKNLLTGGAVTNRPFFKGMAPLMAGEVAETSTNKNLYFNFNYSMLDELKTLLEGEKTSESISRVQQLYFEEISDEDKTEELTEQVTKFSEEEKEDVKEEEVVEEVKDEEKVEANEEEEKDEEKEEEVKEEEVKEDVKEEKEEEKVEASETVTITASEYDRFKTISSDLAKLTRQARQRDLQDRVKQMSFSETNKESVVLPKSIDSIVDFALSLSEPQAEKFFAIIEKLKKLSFQEVGHSNDIDKRDPETVMVERASKLVKEFSEKGERITLGDAMSIIESEDVYKA